MKLHFSIVIISGLGLMVWSCLGHIEPGHDIFILWLACVAAWIYYNIVTYRRTVRPLRGIANGLIFMEQEDYTCRLSRTGDKEADLLIDAFNAMMLRLKNERIHLQEQNNLLDKIVEKSPMGIVLLDFDNNISSLNPMARRFLGFGAKHEVGRMRLVDSPSPLGRSLSQLARNTVENISTGSTEVYRCSHLTFMDRGFTRSFIMIERLTEELHQAEKKAYEKLIRVIAHEVNNTTACVTSALDTVCQTLEPDTQYSDLTEVTQVCIDRCWEMSRFITSFANVVKIPDPQLQPSDLNKRVSNCKTLMESVCSERDIDLQLNLSDRPLVEPIDETLLTQCLVNIVKNAAESIGHGGHIWIETQSEPTRLVITDDGAGISPEAEVRLFNPFFSTKTGGQGLGLVVIRDILTKHGCQFSLTTDDDGLTRFRITFVHEE